MTFDEPVNTWHLPTTACVSTSPPVGWLGWLPGGSTSMTLSFVRTGLPPTFSLSEVLVAVAERAMYANGMGTGPAGGVGGHRLMAGVGPGHI